MIKRLSVKFIIAILIVLAGSLLLSYLVREKQPGAIPNEPEAQVYQLKFGHNLPPDSAQHVTAVKFAEIVHQRSGGRIKVSVYPDQQLGTDCQMIEAARTGKLAIILPPSAKLGGLYPPIQYVDLPFLFPTRQDAYELLDGGIGQQLLKGLEPFGLVGVSFWEGGFKQFTANKAIRVPEDFQGLKIRVMKSRIIADQFKSLGAQPIRIEFSKTYQALSDGVLDGQENPLGGIINKKFHKVQSHLIISNHGYLGKVFAFSKPIIDSLPPDIQKILMTTARELTPFNRKESIKREKAFLQTIQDSGTSVYTLTQKERNGFQAATASVIGKYRHLIGEELLDKTSRLLEVKYAPTAHDEIVIGFDADLTVGSAPSGLAIKKGDGFNRTRDQPARGESSPKTMAASAPAT